MASASMDFYNCCYETQVPFSCHLYYLELTICSLYWLVQEHKHFEDAFKVYERGVKIFKHPRVKDISVRYLSKLLKRSSKAELERARELSGCFSY